MRASWTGWANARRVLACALLVAGAAGCVQSVSVIDLRADGGGGGGDDVVGTGDVGGGIDVVMGGDIGVAEVGGGEGGIAEGGLLDVGPGRCASTCGAGQTCCPYTGTCVPAACLSCCMPTAVDVVTVESGTIDSGTHTCRADADCPNTMQVCVFPAGCGTTGECRTNFACGRPSLPYCGCDGATFYDTCAGPTRPWAASGPCSDAGPSTVSDGATGTRCTVPTECGPGLSCCLRGVHTNTCYDTRCLACCM